MNEVLVEIFQSHILLTYNVIVAAICMARWLGIFFIFPLFVWPNIPMNIRVALAFALSLPIWPLASATLSQSKEVVWPLTSTMIAEDMAIFQRLHFLTIVIKEFFVGVILGLFPGAVLYGFMIAGELFDQVRGDLGARTVVEGGVLDFSTSGLVLFITGCTLLLDTEGFINLISLFYESYLVWPVEKMDFLSDRALFDEFVTVGLWLIYHTVLLVMPFAIIVFSIDLLSFFQTKMDQKFQAQSYASSLKNILFLGIILAYAIVSYNTRYNPTLSIAPTLKSLLFP